MSYTKFILLIVLAVNTGCASISKDEIKDFPLIPQTCNQTKTLGPDKLQMSHIQKFQRHFEREVVKIEDKYYWMSTYRPLMACIDPKMTTRLSLGLREWEVAEQQKTNIYIGLYGVAIGALITVPGGAIYLGSIPVATSYIYDLVLGDKYVDLEKLVDEYNTTLAVTLRGKVD